MAEAGGYRSTPRRGTAALVMACLYGLPLLILLVVWRVAEPQAAQLPALAVFDVPVATPAPAPMPDLPEPAPADQAEALPDPAQPAIAAIAAPPATIRLAPVAPAPAAVPARIAPPPAPAPAPAPATAAAPPAAAPSSSAPQDWQSQVLARLNAAKRYPATARTRRQQGIALIRFTVDRGGRVSGVTLVQGSGFALLDREALALPARAQPLPAPPDNVPGTSIELTVPVDFAVG